MQTISCYKYLIFSSETLQFAVAATNQHELFTANWVALQRTHCHS